MNCPLYILGINQRVQMWKCAYVYSVVEGERQEKKKEENVQIVFLFLHSLSFYFSLRQANTNSHTSFASHGRRPESTGTWFNWGCKSYFLFFEIIFHTIKFSFHLQSPYNNNTLSALQRPLQSTIFCYNCKIYSLFGKFLFFFFLFVKIVLCDTLEPISSSSADYHTHATRIQRVGLHQYLFEHTNTLLVGLSLEIRTFY